MNYDTFYKIIATEPVFRDMRACVENSPYHREANVFEHTMMVCEHFNEHYSELDDDYFIGLFACLFHDLGKPVCRTRKENEKRGVYYSYDGHDGVSATIAGEIMARYNFNDFDIMRICWMIRHHQIFWCVKDNDTKVRIANDIRNPGLGINFHCFRTFMLADDFGRICDERDIDSYEHFATFEKQYLN